MKKTIHHFFDPQHICDFTTSVISRHKRLFLAKKHSKYFFNQKNITPVSQDAGNLLQMGLIRKMAPVSIGCNPIRVQSRFA